MRLLLEHCRNHPKTSTSANTGWPTDSRLPTQTAHRLASSHYSNTKKLGTNKSSNEDTQELFTQYNF